MVRPVRFERMAFGVGVQRSIQLSYGRVCILYYISLFAICKAVIAGRSGRLTAKRPVLRRSGLLGRRFFLFALAVAVLLGEHTAAVILHIHTKLTRLVLSLAEARRKVAVQVLDAVFFGGLLADLTHQLMILVRTDEQRRSELLVAVLGGVTRGFVKAKRVAGRAAVIPVRVDRLDKPAQAVFVLDFQLEIDALCVLNERILAHFVFLHRVDVRVVPETHRLDALLPQGVDARDRTRRTADM